MTVNSLDGRSREDYAADLYKHLGVGSRKDNRGVLLLLAPKEHQYKIEVGYGLEPVINDARAGDIGRDTSGRRWCPTCEPATTALRRFWA